MFCSIVGSGPIRRVWQYVATCILTCNHMTFIVANPWLHVWSGIRSSATSSLSSDVRIQLRGVKSVTIVLQQLTSDVISLISFLQHKGISQTFYLETEPGVTCICPQCPRHELNFEVCDSSWAGACDQNTTRSITALRRLRHLRGIPGDRDKSAALNPSRLSSPRRSSDNVEQ